MVDEKLPDVLVSRLGYLLKHVQLKLSDAVALALSPFGIDGRELAVLSVLAAEYPLSQLEVAGRLRVDRTTMVALIDALEGKGLVERRRSPEDRRKNMVGLTAEGHERLLKADKARQEVDRVFLAPLGEGDAGRLVRDLQILLMAEQS
ncbi:MarR family winged helix-turn-helix transcriptional regulator [Amycolatopsis sp.]|uniref:MarR family winged helix-turn-helix transcriptional regulator n=1 Tax=Amycolatopsis sp. TaxID=37632 RepID=UPI002BC8A134|nr:MarR family transcriptional regulator [Amycolatopsis sp.]HVV11000.1 MarR family transcriptional regulator [Amycolatopsis sp.]